MAWSESRAAGVRQTSAARSLVLFSSSVLGFALLIALSARMSLPVPGSPVPATLQTLAVLVGAGILGPWGGVAAVSVYLGAGLAGAPVFAAGGGPVYLLGPTGGYLLGLLPAAWIAGRLSRNGFRLAGLLPGFLLATLVVHLFGWAQLAALSGPGAAVALGVTPFLALDLLKALAAAGVVGVQRRRGRRGGGNPGVEGA